MGVDSEERWVEAEENLYFDNCSTAALGTLSPVTTCIFRSISLTYYLYVLKIDRSIEKRLQNICCTQF